MRAKTAWMHPKASWEEDRSFHCGIGVGPHNKRGDSGLAAARVGNAASPLLSLAAGILRTLSNHFNRSGGGLENRVLYWTDRGDPPRGNRSASGQKRT